MGHRAAPSVTRCPRQETGPDDVIVGIVDAGRFGLNARRRAQVFDLPSSTPNRPLGCHPQRGPAHRRQHRQAAGAAAQRGAPETASGLLWPGSGPSAANHYPAKLTGGTAGSPMDQRIESFLADVLALAGEDPDAGPAGGAGSP